MTDTRTKGRLFSAAIAVACLVGGYFAIQYINERPPKEQHRVVSSEPPSEKTARTIDRQAATDARIATLGNARRNVEVSDSELAVPEFQPAKLYSKYLEHAENGDLNAAYLLVATLRECLNVVTSEEQLQNDVVLAGLSESVVAYETNRFLECRPLLEALPSVRDEHDRWYQVVREADHPLLLVRQRNNSYDETRALVLIAVSQSYPEPYVYSDIYTAASRLYLEFPEQGLNETRFLAWQMLACSVALRCNYEQMIDSVREELSPHQYAEVSEIETSLRAAIKNGDWEALGI